MPERREFPRAMSQRAFRDLLTAEGWTEVQGGRHNVKMAKPGRRPIPLPYNKGTDYPKGLTRAILREAGLVGPGES